MRSVLFVDPPAFCTSLEGLVAPALRTRPLAVAPPGADRATILALSAEARLAGLERGMPVRKAQRLCPDLIVLPPNPRLYARASRALHEILRIYAPTIEPRGYGHAFLDLTGTGRLFGPPQDVAARIRRETSERLGFSVSVGVASNKLVSQAAIKADRRTGGRRAEAARSLLYVPAGDERGFLAPHPLEVLPELGTRMRARLEDYQLDLIGEVAAIPESALCAVFGREGRTLRARARGIDPRPVLPPERQAEFHLAHALTTDTNDLGVLYPLLRLMSERLGRRLRQRGLTAGRLRVEATYADYTAGARAVPLASGNARRGALGCRPPSLCAGQHQAPGGAGGGAHAGPADGGGGAAGVVGRGNGDSGTAGRGKRGTHRPAFHRSAPALQHALDHIRTRYGSRSGAGWPSYRSPLTSYALTRPPRSSRRWRCLP